MFIFLIASWHNPRPKIQRLVTPQRLQRRRRIRTTKRQNLERQKENKAEYEYVTSLFSPSKLMDRAVLSLPNVSPRKRQKQLQQGRPIRPPCRPLSHICLPLCLYPDFSMEYASTWPGDSVPRSSALVVSFHKWKEWVISASKVATILLSVLSRYKGSSVPSLNKVSGYCRN